jgi:hypothetical protein
MHQMIGTMHDPFRSAPDDRIVKGLDGDFGSDAARITQRDCDRWSVHVHIWNASEVNVQIYGRFDRFGTVQ